MGKRTNTILQSAFFKLANIIPIDDAVQYMKEAAKKSYGRKGEDIVQHELQGHRYRRRRHQRDPGARRLGRRRGCPCRKALTKAAPKLVSFVKNVLNPIAEQKGNQLPVSTFENAADGTFPLGVSAYEKRGVAVDVPEWIPENCIQCNQCSFVCPHATIRPYAMDAEEVKNAPAAMKGKKMTGQGLRELHLCACNVDPLDCMGCGLCANICPAPEQGPGDEASGQPDGSAGVL